MTDLTDLEPIARKMLMDRQNSPTATLPKFRRYLMSHSDALDALAFDFLQKVSHSLGQTERSAAAGQSTRDAHDHPAGGGAPSSSSPTRGSAAASQRPTDAHHSRAGGGAHRNRPADERRATEIRRAIERAVGAKVMADVFQRPIFGKPIGEYSWRELADLERSLESNAIEHFNLGRADLENRILIQKVRSYASPADNRVLVRDVVPEAKLIEMVREAGTEVLPALNATSGFARIENNNSPGL